MDKKNNLKLLLGISGLTAVAAMGWEHYRNHYNLDNHLSFAEKALSFGNVGYMTKRSNSLFD